MRSDAGAASEGLAASSAEVLASCQRRLADATMQQETKLQFCSTDQDAGRQAAVSVARLGQISSYQYRARQDHCTLGEGEGKGQA